MCEGASKQTPDPKILPRRDRAQPTPRLEIPRSATGILRYLYVLRCVNDKLNHAMQSD